MTMIAFDHVCSARDEKTEDLLQAIMQAADKEGYTDKYVEAIKFVLSERDELEFATKPIRSIRL